MNKPLVHNIIYFVGCAVLFVAGLFFILAADLLLTTQSIWLMLAIIFSFSSSIFAFLSGYFKEKRRKSFVFKGVAIGFAVAFISFIVIYLLVALSPEKMFAPETSSFVRSFAIKRVGDSKRDTVYTLAVMIVTIVISVIGLVGQVVDLILTAKTEEK